ncbi:MAG: hypothetical protein EZS28_010632 [Streblomastix strix]|uniref:DM10 domain-containing protein n=1 Tax=Streblomastix strix TaxID=222440 RepID=A0A5J4WH10_9EUKA|nr:MAG: hypothetical protein EZS28_010632 [Streblomastix strix]
MIIRRHPISKPEEVNSFYRLDDLNLGLDVEIYGVTYHIVDYDEFTKQDESTSKNYYYSKKLVLRQFLRDDRKVLRFYARIPKKVQGVVIDMIWNKLRIYDMHYFKTAVHRYNVNAVKCEAWLQLFVL